MGIDCSNAVNYSKERKRMCNKTECKNCGLSGKDCDLISSITDEHIKIVQKWSDNNKQKTRKDLYLEIIRSNGFIDAVEKHGKLNIRCPVPFCVSIDCSKCKEYWNEVVE